MEEEAAKRLMRATLNSSSSAQDAVRQLDIGVIYTHEDHLMPKLLSTLADSGESLEMRLLLVDNASPNGAEAWSGYFPDTKIVFNDTALSYARNLNRILENATAPYVLLLNTDMYFDPEVQCLAKMVEFMRRNTDCGIAGCRLYRADGSYAHPARRFQTLKTIGARRSTLGGMLQKEIDQYLYLDRSSLDQFECDWLSGCFLMVRLAAIHDVGLFDTGFTKYFEDVDFCLRMALAGWRVMFNGETYCYHLEQRASQHVFSSDAWMHIRSYLRWLAKWKGQAQRRVAALKSTDQRRAA